MVSRRIRRTAFTAFVLTALTLAFENCGSSIRVNGGTAKGLSTGGGDLAPQVQALFTANCLSCHGANGSGGLSNINNLAAIEANGFVIPNDTGNSKVYTVILGGAMPPGAPLSATTVSLVGNWINMGAPTQ